MKFLFILILSCLQLFTYGQEVLNLRYNLNYNNTIFENIIVTDSCYYTTSYSIPQSSNKVEGGFVKINLDGTINNTSFHKNDTMHIQFTSTHSDLINTLDNNFAIMSKVSIVPGWSDLMFYKLTPNGDTISTNYINTIHLDGNSILNVNALIQNNDSTYNCIIHLEKNSNLLGGIALLKLSKTGELLWHKYFWGLGVNNYRILRANSIIKYDVNKLLIGATTIEANSPYEVNWKVHTKLYMTDTLGNLLWQRTYWADTINNAVNGLTKTTDGGVVYCGNYGRYNTVNFGLDYQPQITKLDANFDLEWRIKLDKWGSYNYTLNNILTLNDTEFVAVGNSFATGENNMPFGKTGHLVKFNINGKVLWERKYTKVPHFDGESNWATHILYDVALTPDSGFVMVGQSTNFYTDNGVPSGQQGWLVKVDKHGCLVPNCQQYDNVDTTTTDTTIVQPPVIIPENVLYPNPANTSLYYYHTQSDTTQQQTAYMYNLQGKLVQQFNLSNSNITYSIDVSNFSSGIYLFIIKNELGEILRSDKVVVSH